MPRLLGRKMLTVLSISSLARAIDAKRASMWEMLEAGNYQASLKAAIGKFTKKYCEVSCKSVASICY